MSPRSKLTAARPGTATRTVPAAPRTIGTGRAGTHSVDAR